MTEKGGPARHVHLDQDEWFYVLQGEYVMEVGTERFHLGVGDSIYLPRRVPHAWAHISDGTGRLIGAVQPAGTFEQFVEEAGRTAAKDMPALLRKHGMEGAGPRIDIAKANR